ncbi:MAG TPA: recombinase family protein [Candidatus Paceibacterota bacterium]|nr:recombinase family protein [Candidatus Paceibacterota bacterium]
MPSKELPPGRLVAVYGRVSTARQEEDGTIETQLAAVRAYAKENNLTIVREYTDDGWSGDVLARPALDALRQDVKAKLWDAVLSYDPDRLARRYSYQALIMDDLRDAGIETLFVTIEAPKNSEDKILHGVRGLFAEYERAKIGERFRLGKLRKISEGHILVSSPLYGFNYIPKRDKQHGYYEINEEEAAVVRKIFTWIGDEGLTIRQVVQRLGEQGVKPRKSVRGVWATSTLTSMLRNGAYVGHAHYRSSIAIVPENPINKEKYRKNKKSSRKARPKEEWLSVPVPRIVDDEIFERVRVRLEAHVALNPRSRKYDYLLSGKVECVCGRKRVGAARKGGKYLYYDCCDKAYCFPLPRTCFENPISAGNADPLVWATLSDLMSNPDLLLEQAERWMNARKAKSKNAIGDTTATQKEIEKLKKEEERYTKAYGSGVFTLEELKQYTTPVREKVANLEALVFKAREEAQRLGVDILPTIEEVHAFAKEAGATLADLSFEQKRAIVLNTVEKIVGSQESLLVTGFIPIKSSNGWFKTTDRHRRTPERREVHPL